jgi:hypothetical protein
MKTRDHHLITDNPKIVMPIVAMIGIGLVGWAWYEKGFFIGLLVAVGIIIVGAFQLIFSDENLWVIRWMTGDELRRTFRERDLRGEED